MNVVKSRSRRRSPHSLTRHLWSSKSRLITLCAFLLVVALSGGSSRPDTQLLLLLRPISLLVLGYGLLTLTRVHVKRFWPLVAIIGAPVTLTALHLIPLPPALWQALPGREAVVAIDQLLELEARWRPLSLDPQATTNALMAWATPCAVLVLGIQLDSRGHATLLSFTLGLGLLTALWALLQLMGSSRGPLYLYELTNYGQAVGLFANRNHQAVFLTSMIPLIYSWVQLAHGSWKDIGTARGKRSAIAAGGMLLLVPLVLIAGSRAGLLTLVLSACVTMALIAVVSSTGGRERMYRPRALTRIAPMAVGGMVVAGLAIVTIGLGRDRAFERLTGSDPIADTRAHLLPTAWQIALDNFPSGTGVGSFDDVYRMYESDSFLRPEYVNHAHNDFLEVLMTGGLPGALILIFGIVLFTRRAWAISRAGRVRICANILAVAALTALAILFVASLIDYPLRVPAMASYAVLLAIWASSGQALPEAQSLEYGSIFRGRGDSQNSARDEAAQGLLIDAAPVSARQRT